MPHNVSYIEIMTAAGPPHVACAEAILEIVPRVMQDLRHHMRSQRGETLSIPQFRTLVMVIHHPGASLGEVAGHVGLGAPAMSVVIDGLVRRGLLTRAADTTDRRRNRIDITADGRRIVATARAGSRRLLADRLASLDPSDALAITDALSRLAPIFPPPQQPITQETQP